MQAIITARQPSVSDSKHQTMSMEQRPNILIIDEIDGVSSSGGSDVSDSFVVEYQPY